MTLMTQHPPMVGVPWVGLGVGLAIVSGFFILACVIISGQKAWGWNLPRRVRWPVAALGFAYLFRAWAIGVTQVLTESALLILIVTCIAYFAVMVELIIQSWKRNTAARAMKAVSDALAAPATYGDRTGAPR
jgi:hypothetical protein